MGPRRGVRLVRAVVGGCFFALYGLGSLLIGGLLFPPLALLGARRTMRALVRVSWKLFIGGATVVGMVRVALAPEDRARLAAARGCVVVANHLTLLDVVVLMSALPDATAIAKAAARGNFFYSRIVKGVFLVNDEPARVLAEAKKLLAAGTNIVVFPQGGRIPRAAPPRPLRRGAAQLALRTGAPVLPVRLACDPPVLARGQAWYDLGDRRIVWTLHVGSELPVVAPAGTSLHAAAVALTEKIRECISP